MKPPIQWIVVYRKPVIEVVFNDATNRQTDSHHTQVREEEFSGFEKAELCGASLSSVTLPSFLLLVFLSHVGEWTVPVNSSR